MKETKETADKNTSMTFRTILQKQHEKGLPNGKTITADK